MVETQDPFRVIGGDGPRKRRRQVAHGPVADSCVFASGMSRFAAMCPLVLLNFWTSLMICCSS